MTSEQHFCYEELQRRLADAEDMLAALRQGRITAIDGVDGALVVRSARDEARADHIKRVLLAIRKVNQLIVSEEDPLRLIHRACTVLTETVGYLNGWIVLLHPENGEFAAVAGAGFNGGLQILEDHLRAGQLTRCMRCGLEVDEVVVVSAPQTECVDCPLAAEYGGRGGLSRRLHYAGKTYGLLSVSVPAVYVENAEELEFFDEVASDLAFALHRIEATRELRQKQMMLVRTEQIAHIGSWDWDIAEDRVRWSEEFFRISQRDPALGAPSFAEQATLYVAEDVQRLRQAVERCVAEGTAYELELRLLRTDGDIRHCIARGQAERDAAGRIHRLFGFLQDVTEQKHRENRIVLLGQMLDAAPASITIHDLEGRFLFANRITAALHGYASKDDFLKVKLCDLDIPESQALLQERFQQITDAGEARFEVGHHRLDGSVFPMEILAKAIDWEGRPAILSIGTDISKRKTLENQLLQAQKMESIGRLAGGVAHDFNNMLGVILGYTEMLLEQIGKDEAAVSPLKGIQQAALRSAQLTGQLLAFARKQTVAPKVLHLNSTVLGMLEMLRRLIGEDIELVWLPGKGLGLVKIDPSQIDQILANLCINARDAISGTGRVTIETDNAVFDEDYCAVHAGAVPGEYVLLVVSDSGCGMDHETVSHLFEPFFTTKESGKGTGLGLAMIYGIVKQNNGFINVYSEPGRGTTFKIYLPRLREASAGLVELAAAKRIDSGNETILLVEDEPMILQMAKLMLQRLGYKVLPAASPSEAIRLAEDYAGVIHLLMTDVIMPEMNGRDLAGKLLALYPGMKCLFMSGYTANVIAHHGVLDEGVHFIQKPFSRNELAGKVREVLTISLEAVGICGEKGERL